MHKSTLSIFKIVTLVITITTGLSFVYADWTAPPNDPPADSITRPINVGSAPQEKAGLLKLNGGLRIGFGYPVCNSANAGKIRWKDLPSTVSPPVPDGRLEVCGQGAGNIYEWKIFQDSANSCTVTQQSTNCTEPGAYACNCGKSGCDNCETTNLTYACNCGKDGCQQCPTGAFLGLQYKVKYSCPVGDLETDWSVCEPCPVGGSCDATNP